MTATIGNEIRQARLTRGWPQQRLADEAKARAGAINGAVAAHLLERGENPLLIIHRHADSSVADAENKLLVFIYEWAYFSIQSGFGNRGNAV